MIFKRIAGVAALLFLAVVPCAAQFFDQATYIQQSAAGGSTNAQTATLANASSYSDLIGVKITLVPAATNAAGGLTLQINGFGGTPPSVRRPTASGPTATMAGNEFVTGQPVVVVYGTSNTFDIVSPPNTNLAVGSVNLLNSALNFGVPVNLQLNATVATNALTIAVKGNNGSDPSATNPVLIPFRDSTIANGGPKIVSLQSALSFTIASGSTMGCVNGQMCRLWIAAICITGLECTNSAGSDVVGLCAFNALNGKTIAPINEALLQTSASGTTGGSGAQTWYCNSAAVTARAIRIIGYVEIQETTAGTWALGPTYTQLFGPGIKKPGDIVQVQSSATNSVGSTTSATFAALSGGPTLNITPSSAANPIIVTSQGGGAPSVSASSYLQLSHTISASTTLIGSPVVAPATSTNDGITVVLSAFDVTNTTTQVTYGFEGKTNTGTLNYPTTGTGSYLQAQEIMGALEPTNDNGLPLEMVG